jgi:hypothetical protein
VEELANLSQGWDDTNALSITPGLLKAVTTFVVSELIVSLPNKAAIVPTLFSRLLLELHNKGVDLIIESTPTARSPFAVRQ